MYQAKNEFLVCRKAYLHFVFFAKDNAVMADKDNNFISIEIIVLIYLGCFA